MVAIAGVLVGGIPRGTRLQRAVVRERTPSDDQPLFGYWPFAFEPSLHTAFDYLDFHRPFLAVSQCQPPPRIRVERSAPCCHRLPQRLRSPSTPLLLRQLSFEVPIRGSTRQPWHTP